MTSGLKIAGGLDLDDVFAAYVSGTKPANTGFTVAGADIKDRFQPYVSGDKAAITNYKVGGVDLRDIFSIYGPSGLVALGLADEYESFHAGSGASVIVKVTLTIKSDGTWLVTKLGIASLTGSPTSGDWHSVPASGVGAGYEVRFNGGAWLLLSSDRSVDSGEAVTHPSTSGGPTDVEVQQTYTVEIRPAGGGSSMVDDTTLRAISQNEG